MTRAADASEFGRVRNIRGKSKKKRKPPAAEAKRALREREGRAWSGTDQYPKLVVISDAQPADWIPSILSGISAEYAASAFIDYFDAESKRLQWTLGEARQLIRDGYTLEHTVQFTGWPEHMLADVLDEEEL